MDWLDDKINSPHHDETYIGYTTFTRKKVTTSNVGVWLGYRNGECFFEMHYRLAFPKGKFGQDVWTHFKACAVLFDAIWPHTSSPPLILVSSKRAVDFIVKSGYKWLSIEQREKAKMFFWMDTMTPTIESFNVLEPPFSVLREIVKREAEKVAVKVAKKEFFDWTELAE